MPNNEWTIEIDSFNGFCPAWFDNSYPYYGNKNQASEMQNVNIIDPNVLMQGPGTADLTAGNESGAVTTLISSILKTVTSSNVSFAIGGAKVYQFSATAVTNDGTYPMTITGGTYQVADDLLHYKSNLYVFWNDTGTEGEIAKVDLSADTIDVDWGSTVPIGAAHLQDAPHYAINGGDDVAYFTNGVYVGTIDGTTLNATALDFWTDSQAVSVTWNQNRVWIAVNRPNITGSNFNQSAVYKWNGVSSSWEGDPIEVSGKIGALYTKNGVTFIWWQDSTSTGAYNLGYLSGGVVNQIKRYTGSLPSQPQVGEYKGFISWLSSNKVYLWGARDSDIAVGVSQYISGEQTTAGAMASPFGTMLISSYSGSNYSLAKESGYTVSCNWGTKAFKVSGVDYKSQIDFIKVETEQMSAGAKLDTTLYYDKAKSNKSLTQIAYSTSNATIHKILNKGPIVEDFKLKFDWANGSITTPVKIRSIRIKGHSVANN